MIADLMELMEKWQIEFTKVPMYASKMNSKTDPKRVVMVGE